MSRKFILILQIYDSNLISDEGFIQFMKIFRLCSKLNLKLDLRLYFLNFVLIFYKISEHAY